MIFHERAASACDDATLIEIFGSLAAAEAAWCANFGEVTKELNRRRGEAFWIEQRFSIPDWPPKELLEADWPPNWETKRRKS